MLTLLLPLFSIGTGMPPQTIMAAAAAMMVVPAVYTSITWWWGRTEYLIVLENAFDLFPGMLDTARSPRDLDIGGIFIPPIHTDVCPVF